MIRLLPNVQLQKDKRYTVFSNHPKLSSRTQSSCQELFKLWEVDVHIAEYYGTSFLAVMMAAHFMRLPRISLMQVDVFKVLACIMTAAF